MKTILCAPYQKESIYLSWIQQAKTDGITDIQCLSLETFFPKDPLDLPEQVFFDLYHRLLEQKESFPIYGEMFKYPMFIEEIMHFARECCLWEINPEDLPSKPASRQELKKILEVAWSYPLQEKQMAKAKKEVIEKILALPECTLEPAFQTNPFLYSFQEDLKKSLKVLPKEKTDPKRHLFYALNTRQELESIAQDICQRQLACTIVLCSPQVQLPVLKQVFSRYQIPYRTTKEEVDTHFQKIFCALATFALTQSSEDFLECLKQQCFLKPCPLSLLPYFEEHLEGSSISVVSEALEKTKVFTDTLTRALRKEEKAIQYLKSIEPEIQKLLNASTPWMALENAYKQCQSLPSLQTKEELSIGLDIRSLLQECHAQVLAKEDAEFLLQHILNKRTNKHTCSTLFCSVTDLTHPVSTAPITYVVGCSESGYPGFPSLKGIFDEDYVKEIKKYPSLAMRHDAYMSQLDWVHQSALQEIFYSFPTNDYQGREIPCAYAIEELCPKKDGRVLVQKWPLTSSPAHPFVLHHLPSAQAKQLFEKDSKLHGSISTIERFFQCPYSYFLQSGLRVRLQQVPDNDVATIGTIQHAMMEEAQKKYGKQFEKVTKDDIEQWCTPYFEALKLIHPSRTILYQITKQRLIDSMHRGFAFLALAEKETSFTPDQCEADFEEEIVEDVVLKGRIDRIDTNDGCYRILDYKSSKKTLSEKKVKAGIQLQLLTYLIVSQSRYPKKKPASAYYFSMKEEMIDSPAYHFDGRKSEVTRLDVNSEELQKQEWIKKHKFSGWTFENTDENKDFLTNATSSFLLPNIQTCIYELYRYFQKEVTDGNISCSPTKNACLYCPYHPICRYHGEDRALKALVGEALPFKEGSK